MAIAAAIVAAVRLAKLADSIGKVVTTAAKHPGCSQGCSRGCKAIISLGWLGWPRYLATKCSFGAACEEDTARLSASRIESS